VWRIASAETAPRQANSAARVKRIFVARLLSIWRLYGIFSMSVRLIAMNYGLDTRDSAAYFILRNCRGVDRLAQARCQGRASQSARRVESQSGASARPLVRGERFFRCARPGAGEVRDASAREPRGGHEGRCSHAVRPVPADLLSSRGGLRPRRADRTTSPPSRAERGAQAQARGDGLHRATARGRRSDAREDAGAPHQSPAGRVGPSAQHRARHRAQKKR
jgi:hypothetical protein